MTDSPGHGAGVQRGIKTEVLAHGLRYEVSRPRRNIM